MGGGGHHDPRVQEEEKESLDDRVLDLQRPVHQHRLQPQQHQSEELSVRVWTGIIRNNQDIIPSPVITISNPKMLTRSCRNDPILPLVVNFRAYFLPTPKIHSSSIPAFLL